MEAYRIMEPGKFYLIQESENSGLELVYALMTSETAVLLEYENAAKNKRWVRRTDSFFELVETFSEETASMYQMLTTPETDLESPDWGTNEEPDDFNAFWSNQQDDPDLPFKN